MLKDGLFTSESVSEGHPDKIADQISDAILDAILVKDPLAYVACECVVTTGLVVVVGEITTETWVDIEHVARQTIYDLGYTDASLGFDSQSCSVLTSIDQQSSDIAQGVRRAQQYEQGAGDQGMMFGYACDETDVLMPAPITYAHRLMQRQAYLRKTGKLSWLRPDAKSQVTLRYQKGRPCSVHSVVLSTQHAADVDHDAITEAVMEEIVKPILPQAWIDRDTRFYINPTGRFVLGGPQSDCGLTGRKIIVDTYGGMARHGGGCFSGKDPSKVDRSAAYMARYLAKHIVAMQWATHCEVQISYAIGVAEPISLSVHTFGTGRYSDEQIADCIKQCFDLRPYGIIQHLNLLRPIYLSTAAYGHFGRCEEDFTWEKVDHKDALQSICSQR